MKFDTLTLKDCASASGAVVVIDVLRAYTTAAYAFAAGATEILLVKTVEQAFSWRARDPQFLLMGEVGGEPIEGFDFSNSPAEIAAQNLLGRRLVQRTSSGTQGAVCSRDASPLLAASFCVAQATIRYLQKHDPSKVTFIVTGVNEDGLGEEDQACAEYLEACLQGDCPDPQPFLNRVKNSLNGRKFADPQHPVFPYADLQYSLRLDNFQFAMPIQNRGNALVMTAEPV
ncbi:MAG TPA: 2-phosphosulfolactate phosphatase [Anaerolineales bacterium]|nr:2-phosphosulfolactate phosphatase [Anaerolineales bacterium]